jgi:hypothetical protein
LTIFTLTISEYGGAQKVNRHPEARRRSIVNGSIVNRQLPEATKVNRQ